MLTKIIALVARGVRNCNPCNVRHGTSKWKGRREIQTDTNFVQFVNMQYGIRAAAMTLRTYSREHGLNTISGMITRWAPSKDHNDTAAYIANVSNWMKVPADARLDLTGHDTMFGLIRAIIRQENGRLVALAVSNAMVDEAILLQ